MSSIRPEAERALAREKSAIAVHRDSLAGRSLLPPPTAAPKGTFVHGFLLPFSLLAAALRDKTLRGPYLKIFLLRAAIVLALGALVFASQKDKNAQEHGSRVVVVHTDKSKPSKPVKVDVAGIHVDIEDDKGEVSVLGKKIPVVDTEGEPLSAPEPAKAEEPPATRAGRALLVVKHGWRWIVALVAALSATEGFIVFFTRRYDDWLSFHASRLARIKPEDETPKEPKLALDLKWLLKKLKRRVRGYVVFAAGLPLIYPLKLVPTVGPYVVALLLTLWGWYWLGVFTAAKSAHAWIDEGKVGSPAMIKSFNDRVAHGSLRAPLRWYGRLWARLTRGVDPPATTFDRTPAPFLGLALARVVLSFPGLYLLARPIVPVAAGRLCAENDPTDRFSVALPTGEERSTEGPSRDMLGA
jgi:hypothetical protein